MSTLGIGLLGAAAGVGKTLEDEYKAQNKDKRILARELRAEDRKNTWQLEMERRREEAIIRQEGRAEDVRRRLAEEARLDLLVKQETDLADIEAGRDVSVNRNIATGEAAATRQQKTNQLAQDARNAAAEEALKGKRSQISPTGTMVDNDGNVIYQGSDVGKPNPADIPKLRAPDIGTVFKDKREQRTSGQLFNDEVSIKDWANATEQGKDAGKPLVDIEHTTGDESYGMSVDLYKRILGKEEMLLRQKANTKSGVVTLEEAESVETDVWKRAQNGVEYIQDEIITVRNAPEAMANVYVSEWQNGPKDMTMTQIAANRAAEDREALRLQFGLAKNDSTLAYIYETWDKLYKDSHAQSIELARQNVLGLQR